MSDQKHYLVENKTISAIGAIENYLNAKLSDGWEFVARFDDGSSVKWIFKRRS